MAKKHGCDLVDFSTSTVFTDPATLNEDGNHPNGVGGDRIAAARLAALKKGVAGFGLRSEEGKSSSDFQVSLVA